MGNGIRPATPYPRTAETSRPVTPESKAGSTGNDPAGVTVITPGQAPGGPRLSLSRSGSESGITPQDFQTAPGQASEPLLDDKADPSAGADEWWSKPVNSAYDMPDPGDPAYALKRQAVARECDRAYGNLIRCESPAWRQGAAPEIGDRCPNGDIVVPRATGAGLETLRAAPAASRLRSMGT